MWLAIFGVVAIGFVIFLVAKTAAMNNDPRSQELAMRLMLALAESKQPRPSKYRLVKNDDGSTSYDPPMPRDVIEGWNEVKKWLVAETPDKSPGQRTTMVAHALSMVKPQMDQWDFANFHGFARNWDGYST